jgi:hypothetical protein
MHCPGCGQQQISNETKFCNRCGLPLGIVSEVLAYGGYLPQLAELNKKKKLITRRHVLGFSLIWCLFFLLIMTPLWGILDLDALSGASAIVGIFGGLIMMVSALVFLKKDVVYMDPRAFAGPQNLGVPNQQHALPPQQSVPVSSYGVPEPGNWRDTNDLVPSVTESTTRLLDDEERRQ